MPTVIRFDVQGANSCNFGVTMAAESTPKPNNCFGSHEIYNFWASDGREFESHERFKYTDLMSITSFS